MSIFRDFFVKEKPVFTGITRGIGGFGFGAASGGASSSASNKIAATGGVIADYSDGGTKYRAHIFANSGALTISSADADATIEYLVVGGGGGGGYTAATHTAGAGGGAGGLRTNVPGVQNAGGTSLTAAAYPVSAGTYTVVVGDGGPGGSISGTKGETGTDSAFYPPSHGSYPAVQYIRGAGGGGGGNAGPGNNANAEGRDGNAGGGSGGGTTYYTSPTANQPGGSAGTADPNHPKAAGNAGGAGPPGGSNSCTSGGGGGAGAAGGNGRPPAPGNIPSSDIAFGRGGIGVQVAIAGPASASPIGTPGPSGTGWFAGGGGSGSYKNPPGNSGNGSAPLAGGGSSGYQGTGSANAPKSPGSPTLNAYGQQMTGGGGGGAGTSNPGSERNGSPGQPGIVIVRYELPSNNAADEAKATGGAVSKVGSKIIHVFHHPGSLVVPATIPSVQYFLIGGGGAGSGADGGGGGGGGGVQTNIPGVIPGPATAGSMALPATTYAIQVGRGGGQSGATPGSGPYDVANDGEPTTFNSVTGGGGGRGGFGGPSPVVPGPFQNGGSGSNGSSGGGGGSNGPGGGTGADGNGHGFDGANAGPLPSWSGAAGGGAGQNAQGINGGDGIQLPTTYHDPSTMTVGGPGPSSSWGWFGGGGGGGAADPGPDGSGGIGGGGRGEDTDDPYALGEINGMRGTGGGGGGGDSNHISTRTGGMGGPGIVIVAYDA